MQKLVQIITIVALAVPCMAAAADEPQADAVDTATSAAVETPAQEIGRAHV